MGSPPEDGGVLVGDALRELLGGDTDAEQLDHRYALTFRSD